MNQISDKDFDTATPDLYIFDCDGLLYQHQTPCFHRMRDVGAKVIQAYTGMDYEDAWKAGDKSWAEHRDGFKGLRDIHGHEAYLGMHRHFDMVSRLDVSGVSDPELPGLISQLSNHAQICFASHTTTNSLQMILDRLGYSPVMIDRHAYGLDRLGGQGGARKDDQDSGVYDWLCDQYGVAPYRTALVEDSTANLDCANDAGIGRCVLVGWKKDEAMPDLDIHASTSDFVKGELRKFSTRMPRISQKAYAIV